MGSRNGFPRTHGFAAWIDFQKWRNETQVPIRLRSGQAFDFAQDDSILCIANSRDGI